MEALSQLAEECSRLPGLQNAPLTTISSRLVKLFRFANESLEKLSVNGDNVNELLYPYDDVIRTYVVNSGLLNEFSLKTDNISDANILTLGRLFVNLMCTFSSHVHIKFHKNSVACEFSKIVFVTTTFRYQKPRFLNLS